MQEINTTKEKIHIEDIISERRNDLITGINDIKSRERKECETSGEPVTIRITVICPNTWRVETTGMFILEVVIIYLFHFHSFTVSTSACLGKILVAST